METCMLCKENYTILYSICSCLDSNVCRDCYELSNENNLEKCPVCRAELNFKLIYSNYKINILFIINIVCGLLYYITLLTCPIYIIVNNTNNNNIDNNNNNNNIDNIIYKCNKCNNTFTTLKYLEKHQEKCNGLICINCNTKLSNKCNYINHINICGIFTCTKCNTTFNSKTKYSNHYKKCNKDIATTI